VLVEFSVDAVTDGNNAVGGVAVRVREPGTPGDGGASRAGRARAFHGYGASTDIIVAAAEAYVAALNRLFGTRQQAPGADALPCVGPPLREAARGVPSGLPS
jgi:2-isopropylmalate synthase